MNRGAQQGCGRWHTLVCAGDSRYPENLFGAAGKSSRATEPNRIRGPSHLSSLPASEALHQPVDCLFELVQTTREEMEADVRRCIDTAARHSGFILSTSCEIPPRSNPEIVKWFMEAAREYGRYERVLA